MLRSLKRLRTFWVRDDANVTIEFVIWLPVMLGVMMFAANATLLMHRHTLMYDAARDTARQVALGQKTEADARAALLARLGDSEPYDVSVESVNGYVTTLVGVPFRDLMPFGGGLAGERRLESTVTMWVEKNEY